jgi:hypothetical protein
MLENWPPERRSLPRLVTSKRLAAPFAGMPGAWFNSVSDAPQFDDWVLPQRELARRRLEVGHEPPPNLQAQEVHAALEMAQGW